MSEELMKNEESLGEMKQEEFGDGAVVESNWDEVSEISCIFLFSLVFFVCVVQTFCE